MNLVFKISKKKYECDLEKAPFTKLDLRPGGWIIAKREDGSQERLQIIFRKNQFFVSSRGRIWSGEFSEKRHGSAGGGSTADDSDLVAQFPGKVRKVLVSKGQSVKEGDPLVLVEAMKMEFSVSAPYAGTVSQVYVEENEQILPGVRFLDIVQEKKDRGASDEA